MDGNASRTPVPYSPGVEKPEADEAETVAGLMENMRKISDTTFQDSGQALRSVHAKSHGLLMGKLTVVDGLPDPYRQGLFATPGTHPVVLRLSTPPGDILPDSVSTPRGLALKVLEVEGTRIVPNDGGSSQDFVMVNGPVFNAPNAKKFLSSLKLLASTTDKGEGLKVAASALMRGAEKVLEALGGESAKLKSMGGHPETHILGETFFTQVPLRYGSYIAKILVAPVAPALIALTDAPLPAGDDPDALRHHVVDFFAQQGGEWEVRVQLCTDLDKMPIEDASVQWPEDLSAYVTVAHISVAAQPAWDAKREAVLNDGLSFNPWHALESHQPLGSINRARRPVYEMSANLRRQRLGLKVTEPHNLADLEA